MSTTNIIFKHQTKSNPCKNRHTERATDAGRYAFRDEAGEVMVYGINGYKRECELCGSTMTGHAVRGKLNPEKKCSARCQSATGPSCECACGGKNHGAAHAG